MCVCVRGEVVSFLPPCRGVGPGTELSSGLADSTFTHRVILPALFS